MENIKKIMAVVGIITIAALFLGFVTNPPASEGNEKILTVKVAEARGGTTISSDSFIIIVDENGQQETIDLEKLNKKTTVTNAVKINNTLNSIVDKGYKLVSTAGGGDVYIIYTTYTFVKSN